MKIFLTGATGLLGNNVLELLLEKGHSVTALVRNPDKIVAGGSRSSVCKIVTGRITDHKDVKHAATGCEAIINCAGDTSMSHRHIEDYYPINRDICGTLLQVAKEGRMVCLVHVSTSNTIGYGTAECPGNENHPMQDPFTKSLYALSKQEGEQMLTDGHQDTGHNVKTIIINPGYIIGKYDVKPSSGKMLIAALQRRVIFAPTGGKSFVSARTVAEAVVAALSQGISGEKYLATGENLTFKQFYETAAIACGYRQKVFTLPGWICKTVGAVGDTLYTVGISVPFISRNINQLLIHEHYTNKKMVEQLGVTPQPIGDAIKDFFDWHTTLKQ